MWRRVIQCSQIVLEASGYHIETHRPVVKIAQTAYHFRHCIGIHIDWLDRHKRGKRSRILNNDLGNPPRVKHTVVGVNEYSFAAGLVTPSGNLANTSGVRFGIRAIECWASCE